MAFGKGKESTESVQFKRYIGVGAVFVKGVNANKAESEKFFERKLNEEPVYIGESDQKIPYARISFLVQADPKKYPDVDLRTSLNFFIRREARVNRDGTKKQIIDKYGRTAWATLDEIANKQIPVYSTGNKANIDADYRVAYNGEEDLIKFLKAYLGIDDPMTYNRSTGEWSMKPADELPDCEAGLSKIENYFKGDVSEIKEIIGYQPMNKVKVCFGVRTADDGKEYQNAYTKFFLRNASTNYAKLAAEIKSSKDAGAYNTTEFDTNELHEYSVEATNLSTPVNNDVDELPFGDSDSAPF